jgi:diguanylate cyclase (GGDEF)-like protein
MGSLALGTARSTQAWRLWRAWALAAALAAATASAYFWGLAHLQPMGGERALVLPFAAIGIWWGGIQHVAVKSPRQAAFVTFNLAAVPVFVALAFARPWQALAVAFAGYLAAQLQMRRALHKVLLNTLAATLSTAVAILVYRHYPVHGKLWSPSGYAAVGASMLAYMAADYAVVLGGAVAFVNWGWRMPRLRPLAVTAAYDLVASVSLAVIGVTLIPGQWWETLFFFAAVGAADVAWRKNMLTLRRGAEVKDLYAFAREIASKSGGALELVESVVRGARRVLAAEQAVLVLPHPPPLDGVALCCSATSDGRPVEVADGFPLGELAEQASSTMGMAVTGASTASRQLQAAHGVTEGLLAPLYPGKAGSGYVLVAGRQPGYGPFGDHDLSVLKAVATNAGASLRRGGLVDRLNEESAARQYEASHDALTGLPNRSAFAERLRQACEQGEGGEEAVALALLDIDNFKRVNDTLGHQAGDLILGQIGRRLARLSAAGRLVARLGGDEFVMLLEGPRGNDEKDRARAEADELFGAFSEPVAVEGLTLDVRPSVGVAASAADRKDPTALFRQAEIAMYEAKARGSGIVVFEDAQDRTSLRRLTMAAHLRRSVKEGLVDVHYQPVVGLPTGRVTSVEALARWVHDDFGPVTPEEFIPVAERAGIIAPLTWVILAASLAQLSSWRASAPALTVSVNLSPVSLLWRELPGKVEEALAAAGLPPGSLKLELTETSVMSELGAKTLSELAQLGVGLSLDDFGTGHSSLSRLRQLPFGEVKVDRSFVTGMDSDDEAIIRSIVTLAKGAGKVVTAEGVEDEQAYCRLAEIGCDAVQGFWVGPPMPARQLEERMRRASRWPEREPGPR